MISEKQRIIDRLAEYHRRNPVNNTPDAHKPKGVGTLHLKGLSAVDRLTAARAEREARGIKEQADPKSKTVLVINKVNGTFTDAQATEMRLQADRNITMAVRENSTGNVPGFEYLHL